MKKLTLLILSVLLVLTLSACEDKIQPDPYTENNYADLYPNSSAYTDQNSSNSVALLSDGLQCDYNRFYEYFADTDSNYTFSVVKTSSKVVDGLKWHIYILDERFSYGLRYLYESNNPDLIVTTEQSASIAVKAGQYVYCFCSYNEYTATKDVEAGAYLLIKRGAVTNDN